MQSPFRGPPTPAWTSIWGDAASGPGAVAQATVAVTADIGSAEDRVVAVRQWALSLRPKGIPGRRHEDVRLVLPPLPGLKEYVPVDASSNAGLCYAGGHEGVF